MAPFLSNFHYVTNRDLTDFLGQNNVWIYKCIAEMVQIFDSWWSFSFPFLYRLAEQPEFLGWRPFLYVTFM
jgi:hypothetical protein